MNAYAIWAQPQLTTQVLRARAGGCSEIALRLARLTSARHVLELEQRIRALPGVQRLAIDATARRARVVWDTSVAGIRAALKAGL